MTKHGKWWPNSLLPYLVQPDMSQHIDKLILSGSYQQEYCTIIINTPISGPTPLVASDGESHPPFVEHSFIQTSSPISIPPSIPSPVDLRHQHELFKWLQDLPLRGYLMSTTNSEEKLNPILKVKLPLIEPVEMDKLHNLTNHLDCQHVFTKALNLMGNNTSLLNTWWHFDHCINTALWLEKEATTQWDTAKGLFRRLTLLNVNEVLWPIIIKEHAWGYWEMYRMTCQGPRNPPVQHSPVWQSSETSSSIPPLECLYLHQSQSTSPVALITTFDLGESFETAPSIPECPRNPAPLDITTKSIDTTNFLPIPVPPPSMLQVPLSIINTIIKNCFMLWVAVQRTQVAVLDHLLSLYGSHIDVTATDTLWRGGAYTLRNAQEMQVRTPFGGHLSTSDLESLN